MKQKKGSMGGLEEAPTIILLVGLVFLVMATMALVGEKYGNALDTDRTTITVTNESNARLNASNPYLVSGASAENFASPTITAIWAVGTGGALYNQTVPVANGTISATGYLTNATIPAYANVSVSYTYTRSVETVASNVTTDMNTEIANNTSIAGIVLTISLVGIVLSILIGVFMKRGVRV